MAPKVVKRKREVLTLEQKREIIEKIECGISAASIMEKIKSYNLKNCIFNWALAWRDVPVKTLENAWNPLLRNTDLQANFEGFDNNDVNDIHERFIGVGDLRVTRDNVHRCCRNPQNWLGDL